MTTSNDNEVARLREELDRLKRGCQGSCYACEPVGEMNLKLEADVARLRGLLNRAIEAAEEAIRLADIDYENDKFGKVTSLKEELKELARLAPEPEEPTTYFREPTAEETKILDKILEELRKEDQHYN